MKKDAAAMVLQRLLRGRAMQTRMYEGLQSKLALIRVSLFLRDDLHKGCRQGAATGVGVSKYGMVALIKVRQSKIVIGRVKVLPDDMRGDW